MAGQRTRSGAPKRERQQDGPRDAEFEQKHRRGRGGRFAKKGDGAKGRPDEKVKRLQRQLERAGYTVKGGADGVFGDATERALRGFQRDNNLTVDGVLGEQTNGRLFGRGRQERVADARKAEREAEGTSTRSSATTRVSSGGAAASGQALPGTTRAATTAGTDRSQGSATPNPTPGVSQRGDGMAGAPSPVVRSLQGALDGLGYTVGKAGRDGRFGPDTQAAVERFQREHNLPVTGQADPATVRMLSRVQVRRAAGDVKRRQEQRARTHPTEIVLEAVAVTDLHDRVANLEPGEVAMLPDGHAVRHEHTQDGRPIYRVGSPTGWGRDGGPDFSGRQYATPAEATAAALTESARHDSPWSVGGPQRWRQGVPVVQDGRRYRFEGITPAGVPRLTATDWPHAVDRPGPVDTEWGRFSPLADMVRD